MIELYSAMKKKSAFQKRCGSFVIGQAHRKSRRGQTLVEYALIIAYMSVVSIQCLSYLGFIARKQLVYVNCVAIVANTNNQGITGDTNGNINRSREMSAVYAYLTLTSTWGNAPTAWVTPAVTEIYGKINSEVYAN